jgi:hypothetical protein
MNVWRLAGILLLCGAGFVGFRAYAAQGGDKLEWKAFDQEKPFYQIMETTTKQTMKVQSMEVVQDQSQTFWIEWMPQKSTGDEWIVKQKIIGVKMDIKIGGNVISFDSRDANAPANPLTDFFKALVGSEFTLKINKKDLKVTDVQGLDKFVAKLSQQNEQLKPLLEKILSKDAIQQMSDPTFAAFPKDGQMKKEGWSSGPIKLNMGPIGSYETTYTYTPEGGDKINVKATMTYSPPKDSGGLPFVIRGGNLTAEKAEGTITVDKTAGRIKSSEMKMVLKGELKIDIGGMETTVNLTQDQTSTLKTQDDNPIPAKK